MANHKSALKRIRQSRRRAARNRHVRGGMRTEVKTFNKAAEAGETDSARELLRKAERAIRRAASKGVIPKRRASRTVARLARRFNALS